MSLKNRILSHRSKTLLAIFAAPLFMSLLMAANAQAKITVSAVENASFSEKLDQDTPVIYGGVAGSIANGDCASRSSESTCNSCYNPGLPANDNGNLVACNNVRIHDTLVLRITFSSDTVENGKIRVTTNQSSTTSTDGSSGSPSVLSLDSRTPATVGKGQSATVYIPWSAICSKLTNGTSTCEPSTGGQSTGTLRVGVSGDSDDYLDSTQDDFKRISFIVQQDIGQSETGGPNSISKPCTDSTAKGICFFEVGSGDTKAVIKSLKAIGGFPNASNIQFKYVRLFYESSGDVDDPNITQQITPASPHQDLAVDGTDVNNFSVSPSKLTGLDNDKVYYFKAAVVDTAKNVGYYTSYGDDDYCTYEDATITGDYSCHKAVPGEVVGALEKDVNCFIATAAYGSRLDPHVNTFRKFRNQFLIRSEWGRGFVHFYYKHSPRFANMITQNEPLRAASRIALWPLLAFSSLALEIGIGWTIALFAALLFLPFVAYRLTLRRSSRA